jgi:hypothetical protein
VAHGAGVFGVHTLESDSEALGDILVVKAFPESDVSTCVCAPDRTPLHVSRAIPKRDKYLMRERRRPSGILYDWRNIAISNNVGGVKQVLSTLLHALGEERHFALVVGLRFSNLGSL